MAKDFLTTIPLESFDTATLTANYQVVEVAGLDDPCIGIRITNNSSNVILISMDGINDSDVILPNAVLEPPPQTNNVPNNKKGLMRKGQQFYVKSATATAGTLYIAGYVL